MLLISLGHLGTAFFFTFMHYVHANVYLATVAQLMWISAHGKFWYLLSLDVSTSGLHFIGMPGVVYMTMNASIRNDVLKSLGVGDRRQRAVIGVTTTRPITGLELISTRQ